MAVVRGGGNRQRGDGTETPDNVGGHNGGRRRYDLG